mgnify:CR=1 FL=1
MIYIDPPYNTGNDFVYEDDFAESAAEYLANSGQFDEQGNRLVTNTETLPHRLAEYDLSTTESGKGLAD